jgi:hypothetical protein
LIIFGVCANPNPAEAIGLFKGESPMAAADSNGPEFSANLLELQ